MALIAVKSGNAAFTDATQIITLWATTSAGSHYDTFKLAGTNYQVTAGKTLYITRMMRNGGAVRNYFGYGDTAGTDTATVPTTPVQVTSYIGSGAVSVQDVVLDVNWKVPAGKFPFLFQLDAGLMYFTIEGFEA